MNHFRVTEVSSSASQTPQADAVKAKFCQYIHKLALFEAIQFEYGVPITPSFETKRVGQFMQLNPVTFTGTRVEKNSQDFLDEMEKIFVVMYTTNLERLEVIAYQLKDAAY